MTVGPRRVFPNEALERRGIHHHRSHTFVLHPRTMSSSVAVSVAARLRPSSTSASVLYVSGGSPPQVCFGETRAHAFPFDAVLGESSTQADVFEVVSPLVASFLDGFNATVLAYGQTGSGKTHTMMGPPSGPAGNDAGVIPRVVTAVFEGIARKRASGSCVEVSLKAQYLELYNEDLRDLIGAGVGGGGGGGSGGGSGGNSGSGASLVIRESEGGVLSVLGAADRLCASAADVFCVLEEGGRSRKTAATLMNATSSRSHAIFTLSLDQRVSALDAGAPAGDADGSVSEGATERRISKFHLLDLAGSERAKRTGAVGERFREGVCINGSLLALGNVICALSDEGARRRGAHVPYRDSKLTRLLQDSLGGNSRTVLLACVSAAEADTDETLNTLRYAARARAIKNAPKVNRGSADEGALAALRAEVSALRAALAGAPKYSAPTALAPLLDALGASDVDDATARIAAMELVGHDARALVTALASADEAVAAAARTRVPDVLASVAAALAPDAGRHVGVRVDPSFLVGAFSSREGEGRGVSGALPSDAEIIAALESMGEDMGGSGSDSLETGPENIAAMESQLAGLTDGISSQERLAEALVVRRAELTKLAASFEKRLAAARAQKAALEEEVASLSAALAAAAGDDGEVIRLRGQAAAAAAALDASNAKLRDFAALAGARARTEAELVRAQNELAALRTTRSAQEMLLRRERARARGAEVAAARAQSTVAKLGAALEDASSDAVAARTRLAAMLRTFETRIVGGGGGGSTVSSARAARAAALRAVAATLRARGSRSSVRGAALADALRCTGTLALTAGTSAAGATVGGDVRARLEAAAADAAAREARIVELESRLASRDAEARQLKALLKKRDRLRAAVPSQSAPASDNGRGATGEPSVGSSGDGALAALAADIDEFFATQNSADDDGAVACVTGDASFEDTDSAAESDGVGLAQIEAVDEAIEAARVRISVADGRILQIAAADPDLAQDVLQPAAAPGAPAHEPSPTAPCAPKSDDVGEMLFEMVIESRKAATSAATGAAEAAAKAHAERARAEAARAALAAVRVDAERRVAAARLSATATSALVERLTASGGPRKDGRVAAEAGSDSDALGLEAADALREATTALSATERENARLRAQLAASQIALAAMTATTMTHAPSAPLSAAQVGMTAGAAPIAPRPSRAATSSRSAASSAASSRGTSASGDARAPNTTRSSIERSAHAAPPAPQNATSAPRGTSAIPVIKVSAAMLRSSSALSAAPPPPAPPVAAAPEKENDADGANEPNSTDPALNWWKSRGVEIVSKRAPVTRGTSGAVASAIPFPTFGGATAAIGPSGRESLSGAYRAAAAAAIGSATSSASSSPEALRVSTTLEALTSPIKN